MRFLDEAIDQDPGAGRHYMVCSAGPVALAYDARGNLTTSGTNSYTYTSENFLSGLTGGATLKYDPLGRLLETLGSGTNGATTRFSYDGDSLIAEYDGSNTLLRRYVHGPGADAPLVWYEGTGLTNRRWLIPDERGSIIAVTDGAGAAIAVNSYDAYGIPALTNLGRFQYTGQTWIPELGMYNYKARIYSATLGRFMQTDPIGYGAGMNMYAYVGGDPVNKVDPSGLSECPPGTPAGTICVTARRRCGGWLGCFLSSIFGGGGGGTSSNASLVAPGAFQGGGSAPPPLLPPPPVSVTTSQPAEPIITPQKACPKSSGILGLLPHGGGITGGLAESVGLPKVAGAAVQGSLGGGGFVDNNGNATLAAFNSAGAAVYAGGSSVGSPSQSSPSVLGGSVTGGFSGFLTNAQPQRQLSGAFTTRTLDVGVGPYQASISLATGGGIWQLSFSPSGAGLTLGAPYSKITTTTTDSGIGCY